MFFTLQALFSAFAVIFTFSVIRMHEAIARLFGRSRAKERAGELLLRQLRLRLTRKDTVPTLAPEYKRHSVQVEEEMQLHKELYFKLQNLEQYPEILAQSRDLLISLLSEALTDAGKDPKCGILTVDHYTRDSMVNFLRAEHEKVTQQWEQYLARRRSGGPLEMFRNRDEAKWWLKQVAPVKYVDGAWLGHIHKITTPFASRRVSKAAWQVLSEELGDGDLNKNHVHIYRELMKEIGAGLPEGDTVGFTHPRHQLNEPHIWKAAVGQLLISLFPHEFLPEILGFNMHFELLTLETMKLAKELQELKLDAYYFILHISIDNADSGHSAIAMQAVVRFIEGIQRLNGNFAAQQTWKRVQAGFILSESLLTASNLTHLTKSAVDSFPRNEREAEVIKIFKAKAPIAHKIHYSSRLRIGRQTLSNWLAPDAFASKQWQKDFLDDLSQMKPWVRRGDSSKSLLIQELFWGGKMFGAFTRTEVEAVGRWINSLGAPDSLIYWSFTGRTEITSSQVFQNQDITVDYPVFSPTPVEAFSAQSILSSSPALSLPSLNSPFEITATPNMAKFLPIWFTHPCLLESFISIPFKTISKSASSVVRLLRAQYGFDAEGSIVAGMDELRRTEVIGLVELGQEMMRRCGIPEPGCLKEVLNNRHSGFALTMLHLSMRPIANAGLLLGLARAFVCLHDSMTSFTLLSAASREVLSQIARREHDSLDVCLEELKDDEVRYGEFVRGYNIGRVEIESCFSEDGL